MTVSQLINEVEMIEYYHFGTANELTDNQHY